jgi:hypothetical protein
MALNFYELAKSRPITRSVNSASVAIQYIAMFSSDETAVYNGLVSLSSVYYDNLPINSIKADPQGGGVWLCTVEYSFSAENQQPQSEETPDDSTNLGPQYSWDLSAGQVHITQSLKTLIARVDGQTTPAWTPSTAYLILALVINAGNVYKCTTPGTSAASGGPTGMGGAINDGSCVWAYQGADTPISLQAPNFHQAIGVSRDSIAGCDVFAPKFEGSILAQYSYVNLPMLRAWRSLVGKINLNAWMGFQPGEVMYTGAPGTIKPPETGSVTHKFMVGENRTNIQVSPTLIVPYKSAWDYLWVTYKDALDSNTGLLIQVPSAAYVEQVSIYVDFHSVLGFG